MSADLLIKNAKIVTPAGTYEGCVYVEGGRISAITQKAETNAARGKSTQGDAFSCRVWWMSTCT